ncbi:MAG: GNAT family N-acetyltransferase [Lachnospiraceae bacterium]|nr:GNAT family N-acetyltransferase [Lachnospiraceae bacterium]
MKNSEQAKIICSSEADSAYIHDRLREYNARYMHDFADYNFHIEENGKIIAGIVAGSLADTLEVEFLYVDESCRGRGLGSRLLTHVERIAGEKGLKRILLNTYSFQAPEFYKKMGYTEQLCIKPAFDEYTQSYFMKEL